MDLLVALLVVCSTSYPFRSPPGLSDPSSASVVAASEQASIALSPGEVKAVVDRISTLNSSCGYDLDVVRMFVFRESHLRASPAWGTIHGLLERGAQEGCASDAALVRAAVDWLKDMQSREPDSAEVFPYASSIVFLPDHQLERFHDTVGWSYLARLRTPTFRLDYVEAQRKEGPPHMRTLYAMPNSGGDVLRDPRELASPLLLSEESLARMRRDRWMEAGGRATPTRSFKIPRGDPPETTHQWIEIDRTSLLPLAISSHRTPGSERATYVTLFEYGPVSEGSGQSWLRSVVQIVDSPEATFIVTADLTNVSFDVGLADMVMPIDMSTEFGDNRGASAEYSATKGGGDWPADVRAYLSFPAGFGQPGPAERAATVRSAAPQAREAESTASLDPMSGFGPVARVGVALLLVGAACEILSRRKVGAA